MRRYRWALLPLASIAIALAVACGGGGDKANDAAQDQSGGNAYGGGGSSSGSAAQVLDLTRSTDKINELKSFRFDVALKLNLGLKDLGSGSGSGDDLGAAFGTALLSFLGDIKAEGSIVSPDSADIKTHLGGQEFDVIQIGDRRWTKEPGKSWALDTGSDSSTFSLIPSSPTDVLSGFVPSEVLKGAKVTKENVNGASATRYSFDKQALQNLDGLGELESTAGLSNLDKASLDVWVNGDNIPVRVLLDASGKSETGGTVGIHLEMNIRNINDGSMSIKPPV